MKVKITARRGGGGRVLLDFANDGELDGLIRRLRGDA
jgi:hypothetical protein